MTVAELHEDYGEALARYAFRLVRDDDQADDLVQETFIRILGHLATARTAQALSAPRLALTRRSSASTWTAGRELARRGANTALCLAGRDERGGGR
jgi:DNA-directed RNA polymerase specialized sigma24 family protein